MLKRILSKKRYFQNIYKAQKGITGLETAIILIAFVVVAAVFAYTVLSAGLFSTQKSQEAVYSGLKETQGTLQMMGSAVAYRGDVNIGSTVGKVQFTVSLSSDSGDPIDLTTGYTDNGNGVSGAAGSNKLQIAYNDQNVSVADCVWTKSYIGNNNGDNMLDPGEKAVITVWLHAENGGTWATTGSPYLGTNNVDTYHQFTLEVKPATGATLTIQRTTPGNLDAVIDLH